MSFSGAKWCEMVYFSFFKLDFGPKNAPKQWGGMAISFGVKLDQILKYFLFITSITSKI